MHTLFILQKHWVQNHKQAPIDMCPVISKPNFRIIGPRLSQASQSDQKHRVTTDPENKNFDHIYDTFRSEQLMLLSECT